jgi:hypothetical protein
VTRWIVIAIAILTSVFKADACRASLVDTVNVKLNQHDQSRIQELACIRPHAVDAGMIRAYRAKWQRTIEVHVECKPHAIDQGYPVAYFTSCDNGSGIWACHAGNAALEIDSQIGRILVEPNAAVDSKVAIEILRFALTQKAFQGIQIAAALSESTSNVWTIRGLSASSWLIEGSIFKMAVTKDCQDPSCNYRITDFSVAVL